MDKAVIMDMLVRKVMAFVVDQEEFNKLVDFRVELGYHGGLSNDYKDLLHALHLILSEEGMAEAMRELKSRPDVGYMAIRLDDTVGNQWQDHVWLPYAREIMVDVCRSLREASSRMDSVGQFPEEEEEEED